jgi:hypothetical protein
MPPLDTESGTDKVLCQKSGHCSAGTVKSIAFASGFNDTPWLSGKSLRKNGAISGEKIEFDLPLSLLDRLVESRTVPREAKIKSIESWQRELTEYQSNNPRTLELMNRLALAKGTLLGQQVCGAQEAAPGLTTRLLRWWSDNQVNRASAPRFARRSDPPRRFVDSPVRTKQRRENRMEGLRPA